jgi:hypothetical protein
VKIDVDQDKLTGTFSIVAVGSRTALEDLRHIVQTHINLYEKAQERKAPEQTAPRKLFYQQPPPPQQPAIINKPKNYPPTINQQQPVNNQQFRKK